MSSTKSKKSGTKRRLPEPSEDDQANDSKDTMKKRKLDEHTVLEKVKQDQIVLDQFIERFGLKLLADALKKNGIIVDFLVSQPQESLNAIVQELTQSTLQQLQLQYAVAHYNDDEVAASAIEDELKLFIKKYQLEAIQDALIKHGLSVHFLLYQTDGNLQKICQELTSSVVHQNKLKYAIAQHKKMFVVINSFSGQNKCVFAVKPSTSMREILNVLSAKMGRSTEDITLLADGSRVGRDMTVSDLGPLAQDMYYGFVQRGS